MTQLTDTNFNIRISNLKCDMNNQKEEKQLTGDKLWMALEVFIIK